MGSNSKKTLTINPPEVKRYKPQPVLLRGILGRTLEKFGLDKDMARYQFVLRWKEIVGDEIAQRSRPESLRKRTLVVSVVSSAWAQELSFQKHIILHRLKKILGDEPPIDDIMFCVGEFLN